MIIGLYGPSRSGKDSVAEVLVKDFGFEQRNMAAQIREILVRIGVTVPSRNTLLPVPLSDVVDAEGWDLVKATWPETVDWMIGLGQACRDLIGEDVWLRSVTKNLPEKLVIADVRQPNEYDFIKAQGGRIWKVIRPGVQMRGMDGLLDGRQFDAVINNIGSLFDLRSVVQGLMAADYNTSLARRGSGL